MSDKRSVTPVEKETIRDRVVKYIVDMFHPDNVTPIYFDPDDPSKGKLFDTARRGTLDDISRQQTPGIAVEEGDEEISQMQFYLVDKKFRIFINFKVIKDHGVDVYSLLNYYIGRIEQELVTPERDGLHLAELTLSVEPAGNSIQYNGDSDPEPGGTSMFDIEIRHVLGDPFKENADG